jgi:hypothetical protein
MCPRCGAAVGARQGVRALAGLIVHEWLEPRGGAESVVDAMIEAFPDADLFALWNDARGRYPEVQESWIARTPLRRHKGLVIPVLPVTWRTVPLREEYDWALVSSHLFAHHIRVGRRGSKIIP